MESIGLLMLKKMTIIHLTITKRVKLTETLNKTRVPQLEGLFLLKNKELMGRTQIAL
jgi:hypothetical protein